MAGERHTTAIIGVGHVSSQFTAHLCQEIARLYARPDLAAVGVYDPTTSGDEARAVLSQLPFPHISVTAEQHQEARSAYETTHHVDVAHLTDLQNGLIRAERATRQPLEHLIWIVDAELIALCAETLRSLKRLMARTLITVVCFLPSIVRDTAPLDALTQLQEYDPILAQPVIGTALLVDRQSPLVREVGAVYQEALLARSLAAMLFAPLGHAHNPPFSKVMTTLRESKYPFAALALDSSGLALEEPEAWTRRVTGRLTGAPARVNVPYQRVRWRLVEMMDALLTGQAASTLHAALERDQKPLYVTYLIPYDRRDKRFEDLAADISRWLSHVYGVASPSVTQGPGVDLSGVRPERRGDLYCQVAVLYGVPYVSPVPTPAPASVTQPRRRAPAPAPEELPTPAEPPATQDDDSPDATPRREGVNSRFLL
jgi:hypothetical protein